MIKKSSDDAYDLDCKEEMLLHEIFERQVRENPKNTAAIFANESLSYCELNERAEYLADALRDAGVKPDQPVAICLKRSFDLLVGMLGILKAGAAFLPLDPLYPIDRLQFMLDDSQTCILLTDSSCAQMFDGLNYQIMLIDKCKRVGPVNKFSGDLVKSNNLAYIIYTSGSAGNPKGVMIEHRSISRRLLDLLRFYSLDDNDICIHYRSYSYDASLEELLLPLLIGGRVVIASPEKHYDLLETLVDLIYQHKITTINLMPSILPLFLEYIVVNQRQDKVGSLKRVVSGGEVLNAAIVERYYQLFSIPLYHMYGPTEATIDAVANKIERYAGEKIIPIGKPLANTEIYILDEHLKPVVLGKVGELYLGGIGIARGYLNLPELTNVNFISDPYNNGQNDKLYKTGDMVRALPGGDIEFIGRVDGQVKVRGYRIETDEIKFYIQQVPGIKDSAVVVKGDNVSNRYIAAYFISSSNAAVMEDSIRRMLEDKLPGYMLPSQYIRLGEFPLLPSGKIDFPALVQMRGSSCSENQDKNNNESAIAEIWSKVLCIPDNEITADDNFFSIGGTSLTAMQVVNSINRKYKFNLQVAEIFNYPTIKQLVCLVNTRECEMPIVGIERAEDRSTYPLSFAQELVWFHQQVDPELSLYNESLTIDMHDDINVEILKQSIAALIHRHELLRCRICVSQGVPHLKFVNDDSLQFNFVDLSDHAKSEQDKKAAQITTEALQKPFKFSSESLIRFLLVRFGSQAYKLFVLSHHIITDTMSVCSILAPELEKIYYSLLKHEEVELGEIKYRYRDYILWQRNLMAMGDYSEQQKYWQDKLTDLKEVRFPFAHYKDNVSLHGRIEKFEISKRLVNDMKLLAKETEATFFTVLLSVFVLLINRYSSQEDVAIGSVVLGRNTSELDNIFGNFLNTIILRNIVNGKSSFIDLLEQVKCSAIDAYQHQSLPFQELLKSIKFPRRKKGYLPFQLAFIYEPDTLNSEHDWGIRQNEVHSGTAKFDLMFSLEEVLGSVTGRVEYNADIFDNYYIKELVDSYLVMLEGLAHDPNQAIDKIPLLSKKDEHMLLQGWNNTKAQFDNDYSICNAVHDYAGLNRDNIAIIDGDKQLTYREMEQQANVLAQILIKQGVCDAESIVVCCERSSELVISMLGILKVGAVYVPIKSDYPHNRIAYILSNCKCKIVIVDDVNLSNIDNIKSLKLTKINVSDVDFNAHIDPIGNEKLSGISPAYMIYTSGSTGEPKGVLQTHRTLNNLMQWQASELSKVPIRRVACFASIGFDVSLQEVFFALGNGYELCIIPEKIKHSFSATVQYIENNKIDVLFLPTRMLEYLAEAFLKYGADTAYPKYIIVAGEALEITAHIREMFAKYSNTRLINQYGPTETHVVASYQLDDNPTEWVDRPPIGTPIANNRFYVLNKSLQLAPVGVIGELYVSGDNLAHGYVNNNSLTNNRFVRNPFSERKNELMYKTGDLVSWTPDGMLEFVGRNDEQIKVRGFRVELSEIKAVIMQNPDVIDCEVIAARKGRVNHIVAYLVLAKDSSSATTAVKTSCASQLPGYMIPGRFIVKADLPFTANGKVDKQALLTELENEGRREAKATVPNRPKTEIQKRLTDLWSRILGYSGPDISIDDDFFDLGGHSLSVLQLLSHLKDVFNLDLKFCEFARFTTISKLEEKIKTFFSGGANASDEEINDIP